MWFIDRIGSDNKSGRGEIHRKNTDCLECANDGSYRYQCFAHFIMLSRLSFFITIIMIIIVSFNELDAHFLLIIYTYTYIERERERSILPFYQYAKQNWEQFVVLYHPHPIVCLFGVSCFAFSEESVSFSFNFATPTLLTSILMNYYYYYYSGKGPERCLIPANK